MSGKKTLKRVVASCMVGNALEWYDFALYGYFAAIIGKIIFPPSDDAIAILLKSYGIFFSGFVMRPLGAILFGYIGDLHGRKKALMLSIYCMAIPTVLIGLLPTYAQVGYWSAVILTILRLFQGLSMGGEFTGSMIFIVEHAPSAQRGFWGSWASFSVLVGLIIGSSLASGISFLLTTEQLEMWGWRIPFLISIGGSFVGAYMRKALEDPKAESDEEEERKKTTKGTLLLKELFLFHSKTMLRVVLIDLTIAVGFFLICIQIMTYLNKFIGFTYQFSFSVNTLSMLAFAAVIPLAGLASDRWSPQRVMAVAVAGFAVFSVPLFYGLSSGIAWLALVSHVALGAIMGINFAPVPALLVSLFPKHLRYSGVSIAHNLSMAIFGGSTPEIVTFLIDRTGSLVMPGVFLSLVALISFGALLKILKRS